MSSKRETKKVDYNPWNELQEVVTAQGLTSFRVRVTRQNPETKRWGNLRWYPGMTPEDISHLEEIIQQEYGGGDFIAEVYNPSDRSERFHQYNFSIDGPPRNNPAEAAMQPIWNPYANRFEYPPAAQQAPQSVPQVHPMTGVPINPGMGGYPPMYYPPPYPPPMYYPPPPTSREPPGPSPMEAKLQEQNAALQQHLLRLEQSLAEEKRQRDTERASSATNERIADMQRNHDRAIADLRAQHDKTLTELSVKLDKRGGENENLQLQTIMKLNEQTQMVISKMSEREIEHSKLALEQIRQQAQSDYENRLKMFELLKSSNDPSQHAELLARFGEFASNNLSLIMQVAQSGLIPGTSEGEPPWMQPLREGISGLRELGLAFIQKQGGAAAGRQQTVRAGQALVRQLPPRAAPAGMGQPPKPQAQVPAASAAGAPQAAAAAAASGGPPAADIPESMQAPLTAIGRALMVREEPEIVAEMIYNVADYHRYWRALPESWKEIFTAPKKTIVAFLKPHVPGIEATADDGYLDAIEQYILQFQKEFEAQQAQQAADMEREAKEHGEKPEGRPKLAIVEGEASPAPEAPPPQGG